MNWPEYAGYKESSVPWLGDVPRHWVVDRIKWSVASSQNGIWGNEPDGGPDDIRCVRVADFDRPVLGVHDRDVTNRKVSASDRRGRLLRRGDLILEKSGGGEKNPVGFVVLYDRNEPAVTSNFVAKISLRQGMEPRFWTYLHHWLYVSRITQRSIKQTSGIQNLDQQSYLDERVCFPSANEQVLIANFLDRETAKIDALIDKQEQLTATLREESDALWSAELSRLSQSAPLLPLRRVIDTIVDGPFGSSLTSAHYSTEGARVIRLGNIGINEFKDDARAYIPLDYARSLSTHEATEGDVVVAGLGDEKMPLGRAALVPNIGPAIVKADCYRIRPRTDLMRPDYMAWVLSAPPTRNQIALLARGATRARLNTSVIREVEIPVPSLTDQASAVSQSREHLSNIASLLSRAEQLSDTLREYRSALITNAVTGKIDVREAV